jgi:hypothetical protein
MQIFPHIRTLIQYILNNKENTFKKIIKVKTKKMVPSSNKDDT